MSKHSSAEQKLHLPKQLRSKLTNPTQQINTGNSIPAGLPPKKTNANNQYR